ncbi:MAG: hypothetical protein ACXVCP_09150 [Bdellovibrio sp.]
MSTTKNLLLLISAISLTKAANAETTESQIPTLATSVQYSFEADQQNKNFVGHLTLSNSKKNVKLEFEGSGLKKGQYKFIISDSCKPLKKFKLKASDAEIYSFKTVYGEVSSETNLPDVNLEKMDINHKSLVLLKVENKTERMISCGKSESLKIPDSQPTATVTTAD